MSKPYEIPEDELRRLVISRIKRIRQEGEKPKSGMTGIMKYFSPPPNCEICGQQGLYGLSQCPYCGRWVGGQFPYDVKGYEQLRKTHAECYDNAYGCCKVCSGFIKENSERIPCPYCGTLFYRFQNSCPTCAAPQRKPL